MPEKLKELFFTQDSINCFADAILKYYPGFDKSKFLNLIYDDSWDLLELKQKMRHTSVCLHAMLPEDFRENSRIYS